MKLLGSLGVVKMAILGLLLTLSLPFDTLGQGRGRRVGRGYDKKCDKFVNCHDARDGRWDGRGPQRQDGLFDRIFNRNRRNRRFDDDDSRRRSRRSRRFDDDDDFGRLSRRERRERRLFFENNHRGRRRF
jgi:hypothetical protein